MAGFKKGELYTSTQINNVLTYTGITVNSIYLLYKTIGKRSPLRFLFEEILELENFNTQERTYRLYDIDRSGLKKFLDTS